MTELNGDCTYIDLVKERTRLEISKLELEIDKLKMENAIIHSQIKEQGIIV